MSGELHINIQKTAVIVIDLQKGISSIPTEPYSSKVVIENSAKILTAVRKNNMHVFLVHVTPSPDLKDALRPNSEVSYPVTGFNPEWSKFVPELNVQPSDFQIIKHQWGAFYGTELDLQLRRRGITTIVLCGIATHIGVESTARFAYEYGYGQIFAEDAMSAMSAEEHAFTVTKIFPRIGLVRKVEEIVADL